MSIPNPGPGQLAWARATPLQPATAVSNVALTIDGSGHAMIAAVAEADVDLGCYLVTADPMSRALFAAQYETTGTLAWGQTIEAGDFLYRGPFVGADGAGDLHVYYGTTTGTLFQTQFGSQKLASADGAMLGSFPSAGCAPAVTDEYYPLRLDVAFGAVHTVAHCYLAHIVLLDYDSHESAATGWTTSVNGGSPLALDPSGNYAVAQSASNTLAKRSQANNTIWQKTFGPGWIHILGVAADAAGDVWITGWFEGSANFGGGALVPPPGQGGLFLAKLDANGNHLMSEVFGIVSGNIPFYTLRFGVDAAGRPWLSTTDATVDFGFGPVSPGSGRILARFEADGTLLFALRHTLGDPVVAPSGVVALSGGFQGTAQIGGQTFSATGPADVLVARLGLDGSVIDARQLGTAAGLSCAHQVRFDAAGALHFAGACDAPAEFGAGPIGGAGSLVIAKIMQ